MYCREWEGVRIMTDPVSNILREKGEKEFALVGEMYT